MKGILICSNVVLLELKISINTYLFIFKVSIIVFLIRNFSWFRLMCYGRGERLFI